MTPSKQIVIFPPGVRIVPYKSPKLIQSTLWPRLFCNRSMFWIFDILGFYVFCKYYIYLRDRKRYYATLLNDVEARNESS